MFIPSGATFSPVSNMKGEVLEHLSPVLVDEWLTRIQAAVTH